MQIGITGHQRLSNQAAWHWVELSFARELDRFPGPITAVTSLAVGADQLFASLVAQRGGQIRAIIPFPDYERTFDDEHIVVYRNLLARASCTEVVNTLGTDEDRYLAAGRRVVDLADRVLALWDGEPAKGKGGTADIVAYARQKGIPLVHINPISRTVKYDGATVC